MEAVLQFDEGDLLGKEAETAAETEVGTED